VFFSPQKGPRKAFAQILCVELFVANHNIRRAYQTHKQPLGLSAIITKRNERDGVIEAVNSLILLYFLIKSPAKNVEKKHKKKSQKGTYCEK
jgi:hypothetical protein